MRELLSETEARATLGIRQIMDAFDLNERFPDDKKDTSGRACQSAQSRNPVGDAVVADVVAASDLQSS